MAPFFAFSPRCILNARAFLGKNCLFLLFSLRCFVITPRCIITARAFLQKNCLFLLFSPRCFVITPCCIINGTGFFQKSWAFLWNNCRLLLFTPRCFRQKWAIIDNFCQFNRIFWLCLSIWWARIFVGCLLLFLLCPTISKTKGFLFFLCPCLVQNCLYRKM